MYICQGFAAAHTMMLAFHKEGSYQPQCTTLAQVLRYRVSISYTHQTDVIRRQRVKSHLHHASGTRFVEWTDVHYHLHLQFAKKKWGGGGGGWRKNWRRVAQSSTNERQTPATQREVWSYSLTQRERPRVLYNAVISPKQVPAHTRKCNGNFFSFFLHPASPKKRKNHQ